jgi:hypothetical protein
MHKSYSEAKSFGMALTVQIYDEENEKPTMVYKGKVLKVNEKYFSEMLFRKTIINEIGKIFIDDQQKIIVFKKNDPNTKSIEAKTQFITETMDSILTKGVKGYYLENSDKVKKIRIVNKDYLYETIDVLLNPLNYSLMQVTFYNNSVEKGKINSERIVINYTNINNENLIASNEFSTNKYIRIIKGKATLTSLYKDYKLVNN